MSLSDRIKPEDEVLIVASGKSIYAWDYGKPQCIARRTGTVHSLECFNERLIDSGGYKGVRDTMEDKVIFGEGLSWNNVAEYRGKLYGSVNVKGRKHNELHGIWRLKGNTEKELVKKRLGLTRLLVGKPILIDSGDYFAIRADPLTGEFSQLDCDLFATLEDHVLLEGTEFDRFMAVYPKSASEIYLTREVDVYEIVLGSKPRENFYTSISPFLELYAKSGAVFNAYNTGAINFDSALKKGRELFDEHEEIIGVCDPKAGMTFILSENLPRDHVSSGVDVSTMLKISLARVMNFSLQYHKEYNKILSIAKVNEDVVVGGQNCYLELADRKRLLEGENNILWEFSNPITAMTAIPVEVYDEGIRDKVLKGIARRKYFAGLSRGKGVAPLRRVA